MEAGVFNLQAFWPDVPPDCRRILAGAARTGTVAHRSGQAVRTGRPAGRTGLSRTWPSAAHGNRHGGVCLGGSTGSPAECARHRRYLRCGTPAGGLASVYACGRVHQRLDRHEDARRYWAQSAAIIRKLADSLDEDDDEARTLRASLLNAEHMKRRLRRAP